MTIIKTLSEHIEEELQDADTYIELALKWKTEQPDTAQLFYELSTEEMKHMDRLHQDVVRLIQKYRQEHGDPPKGMMELYNYLHEKHIGHAMKIRVKQGMFKEE